MLLINYFFLEKFKFKTYEYGLEGKNYTDLAIKKE
jgi:hypothetical protein